MNLRNLPTPRYASRDLLNEVPLSQYIIDFKGIDEYLICEP